MTQKVTNGIKISIETHFEGMFYKEYRMHFGFGYRITIENQSNDSVQLQSRFWKIKEVLNDTQMISGEGVVGKQPVLEPGQLYTYESGCILTGPFGAMSGYYNMFNFRTSKSFRVKIPSFKLSTPYILN